MTQTKLPPFSELGMKGLFLAWGTFRGSRRGEQIAKHLDLDFRRIQLITSRGWLFAPLKYFHQSIVTVALLLRKRPDIVFMQTPPPFAPVVVYLYSLVFRRPYLVDVHSGALTHRQWQWSLSLQRFLSRRALATIVTNDFLAKQITAWGAKSFVLEDPPIEVEASKPLVDKDNVFRAVMICGADPDEPIEEVLTAARCLPDIEFYITGDFHGSPHFRGIPHDCPQNVSFTGYLANQDYDALLITADVIITLTTDDHTFQSGANESLWIGKPIITSDWDVLRRYFYEGTVHTNNTAEEICKGILTIRANYSEFVDEILNLKEKRRQHWRSNAEALLDLINGIA